MLLYRHGYLLLSLIAALLSVLCSSCKEEEGTNNEYDNWQARNERFFASLEDSMQQDAAHWQRFQTVTATDAPTDPTKYIYVKRLRSDDEVREVNDALNWETSDEKPLYTDSVRVAYRGRLIPSASHPNGLSFDYTYVGAYDRATTATKRFLVQGMVEGFTTALVNMKRGERWMVYIPHQLGYGSTEQNTIPAYSTLIFDIDLFDFCHVGSQLRPWQ